MLHHTSQTDILTRLTSTHCKPQHHCRSSSQLPESLVDLISLTSDFLEINQYPFLYTVVQNVHSPSIWHCVHCLIGIVYTLCFILNGRLTCHAYSMDRSWCSNSVTAISGSCAMQKHDSILLLAYICTIWWSSKKSVYCQKNVINQHFSSWMLPSSMVVERITECWFNVWGWQVVRSRILER